jgi:hypothetical protein
MNLTRIDGFVDRSLCPMAAGLRAIQKVQKIGRLRLLRCPPLPIEEKEEKALGPDHPCSPSTNPADAANASPN